MNQIKVIKDTENFCVAGIGNMSEFAGKVFIKEAMNTNSMEVSVGSVEPGEAAPFSHKHKKNEEVYIIVEGKGVFVLDNEEIDVESGNIIRIAPCVSRSYRNNGSGRLIFICIQAKSGSLEGYTMSDGMLE